MSNQKNQRISPDSPGTDSPAGKPPQQSTFPVPSQDNLVQCWREEVEELQEALEKSECVSHQLRADNCVLRDKLSQTVNDLRKREEHWRNQEIAFHKQSEDVRKSHESKNEEWIEKVKELDDKIEELKSEVKSKEEEIQGFKSETKMHENRALNLKDAFDDRKAKVESLEKLICNLQRDIEDKNEVLVESRHGLEESLSEIQRLKSQLAQRDALCEIQRLKSQLAQRDALWEGLVSELKNCGNPGLLTLLSGGAGKSGDMFEDECESGVVRDQLPVRDQLRERSDDLNLTDGLMDGLRKEDDDDKGSSSSRTRRGGRDFSDSSATDDRSRKLGSSLPDLVSATTGRSDRHRSRDIRTPSGDKSNEPCEESEWLRKHMSRDKSSPSRSSSRSRDKSASRARRSRSKDTDDLPRSGSRSRSKHSKEKSKQSEIRDRSRSRSVHKTDVSSSESKRHGHESRDFSKRSRDSKLSRDFTSSDSSSSSDSDSPSRKSASKSKKSRMESDRRSRSKSRSSYRKEKSKHSKERGRSRSRSGSRDRSRRSRERSWSHERTKFNFRSRGGGKFGYHSRSPPYQRFQFAKKYHVKQFPGHYKFRGSWRPYGHRHHRSRSRSKSMSRSRSRSKSIERSRSSKMHFHKDPRYSWCRKDYDHGGKAGSSLKKKHDHFFPAHDPNSPKTKSTGRNSPERKSPTPAQLIEKLQQLEKQNVPPVPPGGKSTAPMLSEDKHKEDVAKVDEPVKVVDSGVIPGNGKDSQVLADDLIEDLGEDSTRKTSYQFLLKTSGPMPGRRVKTSSWKNSVKLIDDLLKKADTKPGSQSVPDGVSASKADDLEPSKTVDETDGVKTSEEAKKNTEKDANVEEPKSEAQPFNIVNVPLPEEENDQSDICSQYQTVETGMAFIDEFVTEEMDVDNDSTDSENVPEKARADKSKNKLSVTTANNESAAKTEATGDGVREEKETPESILARAKVYVSAPVITKPGPVSTGPTSTSPAVTRPPGPVPGQSPYPYPNTYNPPHPNTYNQWHQYPPTAGHPHPPPAGHPHPPPAGHPHPPPHWNQYYGNQYPGYYHHW